MIDPEPDTCEKVTSNMDPKYSKVPQDKMDEIETYCGQLPKAAKIDVKRFHLQQRIALVTRDKQKSYFPETVNCEDGWKRYFLKYPRSNGYMSVSRIGFDHEKRFAGVYFSYIRGCLDAEGHNILLEKTGDGWKIAYDVMPWVS
ncbi:MAG TPA: hypothetical protein VL325_10240 [Pyrinomonadaceae bacterium]|nr:hypothetical protein [Pyrinomonadaceae bacterium]